MKPEFDTDKYIANAMYAPDDLKPLNQFDRFRIAHRLFQVTQDLTSSLNVAMAYKPFRDAQLKEGLITTPFAILQVRCIQNNDTLTNECTLTGMYAKDIETGEQTLIYMLSPSFIYSDNPDIRYKDDDKSMIIEGRKFIGFDRRIDLSNNPLTAIKLRQQIKEAQPQVNDEVLNTCFQVFDSSDTRGNPVEVWFIQQQILVVSDTNLFLQRYGIKA